MSLLKQLIKESSGATGAGGVANNQGSLFSNDSNGENQVTVFMRRMGYIDVSELPRKNNKKKWLKMIESTAYDSDMKSYDYNEVLSKLDQAVKTVKAGEDVAVFGIEDADGGIVKVYVDREQADEFEVALADMLAGESDMNSNGEYEPASAKDIAEIIYELKSKFDIVDAEWGDIEGTEEEESEGDITADSGEENGDDEDAEDTEDAALKDDDTEQTAMTALQSVIAAMQSDADAKKAEAEARKAEAESKIAQHSAEAAMADVKKHEDILDMENHEKAQRDAKKEAETLAKLAKYRKEVKGDINASASDSVDSDVVDDFEGIEGSDVKGDEEEELINPKKEEITKDALIDLIYKSLMASD